MTANAVGVDGVDGFEVFDGVEGVVGFEVFDGVDGFEGLEEVAEGL